MLVLIGERNNQYLAHSLGPARISRAQQIIIMGGNGSISCKSDSTIKWKFNGSSTFPMNVKIVNKSIVISLAHKFLNQGLYECTTLTNNLKLVRAESWVFVRGKFQCIEQHQRLQPTSF